MRSEPAAVGELPGSARPAERLLRSATKLFAAQGIRTVGIDQILRDAGVAKASLYSTYGSKDALVLAYLDTLDQADRNRWAEAVDRVTDPVDKVLALFELAAVAARARGFRGCLYANAAAEFPDVELEPVRAHRQWLRDTVGMLAAEAGVPAPDKLARKVQLLYDGALLGSKAERDTAPIALARTMTAELIAEYRA